MNGEGKKGYVILNGSVAKQVANILTNKIIEGEYPKGSFLPTEEVLCSDFGLGRSSVREAIKTLESRGLVRKIQGKGVEIIDKSVEATSEMLNITLAYSKTSLKDLMDFRVSLEMKNVEWAAKNATLEDIASMQQSLDMMKRDDFNSDDFATYDYMFHEAIAKASGNGVSLIMVKALQPLLYKQIVYTLDPNFNPEKANHFHEYIFEAIKAREPEKATKAMYEHLCETQRIISDLETKK
ncbi:MAG: FadR/GntR family transcriptional regulator [Rikenellaceae bacterium]